MKRPAKKRKDTWKSRWEKWWPKRGKTIMRLGFEGGWTRERMLMAAFRAGDYYRARALRAASKKVKS